MNDKYTGKTGTAQQARSHDEVIAEVMDPGRSKGEHEWYAAREIMNLRDELVRVRRYAANKETKLTAAEKVVEAALKWADEGEIQGRTSAETDIALRRAVCALRDYDAAEGGRR